MELRWPKQNATAWRANVKAMQQRIQDRLRTASASYAFLHRLHRSHKSATVALRARAAGLGVARVFKDNVVYSRVLDSLSNKQLNATFLHIASYLPGVKAASVARLEALKSTSLNEALGYGGKRTNESVSRFYPPEESQVVRLLQAVAVPVIGNICHVFMHGFNHTEVYGAEKLRDAISHRPHGQALITVSNHVASMDDPLVLSSILPPRLMLDASYMRWILCATDRCFTNPAISAFFRSVKVLPVARGEGIFQKGMDMALEKIDRGDWVHIFPEGTRSRDGGRTVGAAKKGVGRLVLDARNIPLVVPIVHTGMEEVMPIGSKFPSIQKKVTVLVGDPIEFNDLILLYKERGDSDINLYEAIALRVGDRLQILKENLDRLVLARKLAGVRNDTQLLEEKIKYIFSNVDWEAQGIFLNDEGMEQNEFLDPLGSSSLGSGNLDLLLRSSCTRNDGNNEDYAITAANGIVLINKNLHDLQEGLVSRLQRFMDPAVFVGFAARGIFANKNN